MYFSFCRLYYSCPAETFHNVSITDVNYTYNGGCKATVVTAINSFNTADNHDNYGQLVLYDGTTSLATISSISSANNTFNIAANETFFNTHHTFKVVHEYSANNKHNKTSNDSTLKAFMQVSNITATYEQADRRVKLQWSVPLPTVPDKAITGDYFVIQRATDSTFTSGLTSLPNINYNTSQSSFDCFDDSYANQEIEGTFHYRIRRTGALNSWTNNCFMKSCSTVVNSNHLKLIDTATVKLVSGTNPSDTIKWRVNSASALWTNGSRFVLKRVNLTNSTETTVLEATDKNTVIAGQYIDELISNCNRYSYRLEIVPGSSAYTRNNPLNTNTIKPVDIGSLTLFGASKGYHPNKVAFEWKSRGYFNEFMISRRVYAAADTSWQWVRTVQGSEVSSSYQSEDEQGEPGVIYEYKIVGVVSCDNSANTSNTVTDIGFRRPVGMATGRVTYGSGTAVRNAKVMAEVLNPEDGASDFRSITFAGNNSSYMSYDTASKIMNNSSNKFTFQAWLRPNALGGTVFNADQTSLAYSGTTLTFTTGGVSATAVDTFSAGIYRHITAVYDGGQPLKLYINDILEGTSTATVAALPTLSNALDMGKNFNGSMDEVRIWGRALDTTEINNNYRRYLVGNENGLKAYWRFEEAIPTKVYDMSSVGNNNYNKRDVTLHNATISTVIPTSEQLSVMGLTDTNGNYVISAIPYSGTGTNYKFTPMFGVHTFNPSTQLRMIGQNTPIQDNINFEDVSSFPIQVSVYYSQTHRTFPVEGVSFKVDGMTCMRDGQLITTGTNGKATIDVPIGFHNIKAQKTNHTFELRGYFPYNATDTTKKWDFQQPENINFFDNTVVKMVGRIAGGPVEAGYPLGFGQSTNNIGHARITLKPDYSAAEFDHRIDTVTNQTSKNRPVKTTTTHVTYGHSLNENGQTITIDADTVTGEFIAYLLPERYTIQSVKYGVNMTQNDEQLLALSSQSLNLSSGVMWQNELLTEKRDTIINFTDTTTYTATLDTFKYEYKQSFIYRSTPALSVYNEHGQRNLFYGEEATLYENDLTGIFDTIPLKTDEGKYAFGSPAFVQMGKYGFVLTAYEPYTNLNNRRTFEVPVTDGRVQIDNELDRYSSSVQKYIDLDSTGWAYYQFVAGDPSFTQATDRNKSFLKNCTFTLSSGGNYVSNKFTGFILGALPTGNNFITLGPKTVDFIIRDPYGSGSSASIAEGISVEKTYQYSHGETFGGGAEAEFHFGGEVKVFVGVGAGTITDAEARNDLVIGAEDKNEHVNSTTTKHTTTTTTTISTSDSPYYIGADGDVFVGSAVNIVYGKSNTLGIVRNDTTNRDMARLDTSIVRPDGNKYTIGHSEGLFFSPSFATKYSYTQYYIVNNLIPNLTLVRNSYLRTDIANIDSFVNHTDNPVYLSRLPASHAHFGANNNNTDAFGLNLANADLHDGMSYRMVIPQAHLTDSTQYTDSIRFFNQEIASWYKVLKENEQEKLNALVRENRSFDAGTTVQNEVNTCSGKTTAETWDVDMNVHGSLTTGFTFNKLGLHTKLSLNVGYKYHKDNTTIRDTCAKWTYTLADHDWENYFSMDIFEPTTPGHGPMFRTRGGQSSCPYEGEARTQFYEPGRHVLSYATMRICKPEISMNAGYVPVIANVPGNLPAIFHVILTNVSETGSPDWFEAVIDETSNPHGAIIEMDGYALNTNRVFRLMPNVANQKLITVRRGPDDAINDYTNLRILFRTQCYQYDVDTLIIAAHFLPYCSNVSIVEPTDNSIVNILSTANLPVRFSDFDLNNVNFSHLALQYNDGSGWVTVQQFYADTVRLNAALQADPTGQVIPGIPFTYNFDMSSKSDGNFKLRAASLCYANGTVASPLLATGYSAEVNMVKDMMAPVVFGSIQPADGILDIGDDIMITFNEPINESMLTANNFAINGILNGYSLNHNAGVSFNGVNESVDIAQEMNLAGKSFTVEMWLQIPQGGEDRQVTLFNHGNEAQSFSFGFTPANKLFVKINGQTIESNDLSSSTLFATHEWAHLAVVVTTQENNVTVAAYLNDNTITFDTHSFPIYEGCGIIKVGAKLDGNETCLGSMHELRIWMKPLSISTVYEKMSKSLSGNENGLMGYWQMDEARGTVAYDKARSRQALMNAQWFVLPLGKAVTFNGSTQMIEANFVMPIGLEQDYALTFWFKGATPQNNGALFSLGNGMDDYVSIQGENSRRDKLSIFVENGQLYVQNNQHKTLLSEVNPFDAHWHHLAFSVRRNANATAYLDGIKIKDMEASLFGGLTGDKFVLGARKWNTGNATYTTDMYFNGQMDEFRMWQYALTNQIIELDMTAKLRGNEMGLAAYYPFEKYENRQGAVALVPTLDDQWINPIAGAPNGGTATYVNGDTNLSNDAAKIKDARPLRTVNYTAIVNNDKINIVVNEPMALIENCVIEFTMKGIRDLHNNVMTSTKKWTAYINQNYLKWSEKHITIRKQQFEPYTFKVNAVNKSGVQQTFSVENLPAWLTASPSSGTIAPVQSQEITFTVSEGLNVGIYDENIYLRGESGIDELLAIDLRVLGEQPDWTVNPSLYNYSMNIIGELNINGIFSTDVEDRIAAFNGQTCVGVCTLRYVQQFDKYLAFLTIYGNTSGTPLSFKIWDASTGTTYAAVIPDTLTFQENSYSGTVINPIIFKTVNNIEQVITLKAGWNWISKNVTRPEMTNTNEVFKNNQFNEGDFLKSQFNNHDEYHNGIWSGAISNSGGLTNTQAYMLQVAAPKNVLLYGEAVNTSTNKITLYSGWSWIGYTPQINLSVNEAFVGAQPKDGDLVKNQNSFAVYYDGLGEWMGTLNYLTPGSGYLYSSKDSTKQHSYPNISSLGNNKSMVFEDNKSIEKSDLAYQINRNQYPNNFSLIAVIVAENINLDNGKILAYAAGECRGIGLPVEVNTLGSNRYFITVSGHNQNEMITFRFESESGEIYSLHEVVTYKDNQLIGSITQPFTFTIGAPAESKMVAYPVPFTNHLTVSYLITENDLGAAHFDIVDVNGKVLSTFEVNHTYTGTYTHAINDRVAHLTHGVYFIVMTNKSGKHVVKVVKL